MNDDWKEFFKYTAIAYAVCIGIPLLLFLISLPVIGMLISVGIMMFFLILIIKDSITISKSELYL